MYAMASVAAGSQTTSQPENWVLVTLKKGQPDSYLFLCCMLFLRVPQFEGMHVDPRGDPRGDSRVLDCDKNFPANLGQRVPCGKGLRQGAAVAGNAGT
jgi:hypothetical protein